MNYWKEHFDGNAIDFKDSLFKQVDMTINGKEAGTRQLELRIDAIVKNLFLCKSDVLLDVCCGNGMITKKIADYVSYIYGVDLSEGLIKIANTVNNADNIKYGIGDFANIDVTKFSDINKINVYSGLQYVTFDALRMFLKNVSLHKNPLTIYFGNVPDKAKIWEYYDTDEKKEYYLKREKEGKPHLGTWYNKPEIENLVSSLGFTCEFLEINKEMNTSHYRFDILLKK